MWKIFRKKKQSPDGVEQDTQVADEEAVTLPSAVLQAIPEDERGGPAVQLEDGRHVIVGRRVLMVADDTDIVDSGMWHEVQYASWRADDRVLTLVWTDVDKPALVVATKSENPKKFMEAVTLRVDNTIVATRSFTTAEGVNVAASVRRRFDGHLFSTVVASGPTSAVDEQKAIQLEAELREELGLDG